MRIIRHQVWRALPEVIHGESVADKPFIYWSNFVEGMGDKDLKPKSSLNAFEKLWRWLTMDWFWTKYIILRPIGEPDALIRPGYWNVFGDCKVSSASRKVFEGPFAMRMGPENCKFFVASDKDVKLEFVKYARGKQGNYDLY